MGTALSCWRREGNPQRPTRYVATYGLSRCVFSLDSVSVRAYSVRMVTEPTTSGRTPAGSITGRAGTASPQDLGHAQFTTRESAEVHMERGYMFEWVADDDADLSWMDARDRAEPHEVLGCICYFPSGAAGPSLWGIVDPDIAYARQIERELEDEARQEIFDSITS